MDFSPTPKDSLWKEQMRGLPLRAQEDAFFEMVYAGKVWHAAQLLDMGVSVQAEDSRPWTGNEGQEYGGALQSPLHHAVELRDLAMAEMLLVHGADTEMLNESLALPLVLAVSRRDKDMTTLLLVYGADPDNEEDSEGSAREVARRSAPELLSLMPVKRRGAGGSAPTP